MSFFEKLGLSCLKLEVVFASLNFDLEVFSSTEDPFALLFFAFVFKILELSKVHYLDDRSCVREISITSTPLASASTNASEESLPRDFQTRYQVPALRGPRFDD